MSPTTQISTAPDGTTLSWTRRGAGAPVILVHGITERGESWGPVADALATTNDVITVDLRGHGQSGKASDYGLASMTGDVAAVMTDAGVTTPHLIGHSLGGAVVSAAGAVLPVASVINVDQSLNLGGFKEQLGAVEEHLRDAASFPFVIEGLFEQLVGTQLGADEQARIGALRSADQEVVLGVWNDILTLSVEEIDAIVEDALQAFAESPVPYLSLFGIDPGGDYASWLGARVPGSIVELWADNGHYPHLVAPDRFVARVHEFWASLDSKPRTRLPS